MDLKEKEILNLLDTDFLLTKSVIISKLEILLQNSRASLINLIKSSSFEFPARINIKTGKISRGENYRGLPYLVLDYPALFNFDNTFAFRTMFWWGNFFSSTLHLQFESLENYRDKIISNLNSLVQNNVYLSVGETPWEYHYEASNYQPISEKHINLIEKASFLKLSKKLNLENYHELPQFSSDFLTYLLDILES